MILGIDPSLTGTAIVRGDARDYELERFSSANQGDDVANRVGRYDEMIDRMITWLSDRTHYDAVYIEAYSYGSNDSRAKFSAEFGGLLRWHLVDISDRIFEVAPMTLKKFCTGSGKGDKTAVISCLSRRYGVSFKTNDEFDAFGLFRLGLVGEGLAEPDNQAQREAADKVLGIVAPKAKKTKKVFTPQRSVIP